LLVTEVDFVVSFIHLECAPFGYIGYVQVPIITNNEAHSSYCPPLLSIIHADVRSKFSQIMVIVQCGFPEVHQNQPACDVMRQFAKEAGFEWIGALAMGMGGALGGRPLEQAGGMIRNIRKAFDLAAQSLCCGEPVPQQASAPMAKRIIAKWLYLFIANREMKSQAKIHGVLKSVYSRPYGS
jgi:hypothetical protein